MFSDMVLGNPFAKLERSSVSTETRTKKYRTQDEWEANEQELFIGTMSPGYRRPTTARRLFGKLSCRNMCIESTEYIRKNVKRNEETGLDMCGVM